MQRRIGQEHAEPRVARRDAVGEIALGAARHEHNRRGGGGEQLRGRVGNGGARADGVEVGEHDREWFLLAVLAATEFRDGSLVGCIAHEVVAADALDRHDARNGPDAVRADLDRVRADAVDWVTRLFGDAAYKMAMSSTNAAFLAGSPLASRYRRLLWAYPDDYQAERGDEIVGTYLDTVDPGRREIARLAVEVLLEAAFDRITKMPAKMDQEELPV